MAKRKSKKPVSRRKRGSGLSGLDAIPREIKAIVPGDAKQYQLAKTSFQKAIGEKSCENALRGLANAAFHAGVAKAAATASGEPGGAKELYDDFIAQRDEFINICQKK